MPTMPPWRACRSPGAWSTVCSGGAIADATATTTGACSVTSPKVSSDVASVTFTVNDLALAGYAYQSGSNHEGDGDSTGTVITVLKP